MLGDARREETSPKSLFRSAAFHTVKRLVFGGEPNLRRGVKRCTIHQIVITRFAIFIMSFVTSSDTYRLQKIVVDQLRTEKNVKRMKVSEAANELKTYVEKIQREDPLVVGVPGNQNPFKERSICILI